MVGHGVETLGMRNHSSATDGAVDIMGRPKLHTRATLRSRGNAHAHAAAAAAAAAAATPDWLWRARQLQVPPGPCASKAKDKPASTSSA